MSESGILRLSEQEALDEIVETVMEAEKGEAPFALVLGSGFSRGLVPTASELVTESLPVWMKCEDEHKDFDKQTYTSSERGEIARAFWKSFVETNLSLGLKLTLDSVTGLPEDNGEAYRAAFTPGYRRAVGAPAKARKFQRELMQLNKPRLNAAHFLLASLLGVQPGKTRESSLFRADAAFSRLILTTNFDPFLQVALQAVNRLYFMSDTPKLGVSDEILDDQIDAIHLVYLHGSVHRRFQMASDDEIREVKEKNVSTLAAVLKRRGVIVLGYSGWDDAIVGALAACDTFDYRLYWCGLESDPLAKGAFGAGVASILRKDAAFYVQSAGAGYFMAQLCKGLVKGNPRLLDNPIGQVRDLLDSIDLKELEEIKPPAGMPNAPQLPSSGSAAASVPNAPQLPPSGSAAAAMVQKKQSTMELLRQAEQTFFGQGTDAPVTDQTQAQRESSNAEPADGSMTTMPSVEFKSKIEQLLSSAQLALGLGNYEECLKLCNQALAFTSLEVPDKARLLMLRALAYYFSGRVDDAMTDYTQIIEELPDAPVEQLGLALVNRGVAWGQKGETEKGMADYTRVIEQLSDAPVEQLGLALVNRGVAWGLKGETEKAMADYTRVIEQLSGPPVEQLGLALVNRGVAWGQKGETEKAMADYTRVIEQLSGPPVEQLGLALVNRGFAWGQQGETEKAIADYTRVIEQLPGASPEQLGLALVNRGVAWSQQGETEKALADYTRVIEQLPEVVQRSLALLNRGIASGQKGEIEKAITDYTRVIEQSPEAPVEQLGLALVNRGVAWGQKGETEKAIADYTRVIEQSPDAPVEQLGLALVNRGVAWGQKGETEKAIADYTRVIEQLSGVPVEQLALTIVNRGVAWGQKGESEKSIADYTRVIEQLPGASDEQLGLALVNRGVAWGLKGETEKAMADYTRVIEQLSGPPVEQLGLALVNRGVAWGEQGETEKAMADYTRVIEQLSGPPVEQLGLALVNRGFAWGQQGETEKAIADYTRVIEQLPGASPEQLGLALVNRGVAWGQKGETEKAIADYTRVIEQLPGAPMEQVAKALMSRGVMWGQQGESEKALADYTRVIEQLPGASAEQVAQALNYRGITWGQQEEMEKALEDYTRVIELNGAPVEQVASALGSRGWLNYQKNDFTSFLADTEAALSKDPRLDFASFNLGLAFLAAGRDADALAAYRIAGERFPESIEALGLADLREASQKWLTNERAQPVMQLLRVIQEIDTFAVGLQMNAEGLRRGN